MRLAYFITAGNKSQGVFETFSRIFGGFFNGSSYIQMESRYLASSLSEYHTKTKKPTLLGGLLIWGDDEMIKIVRCFAPIMDSLFCGKATAVAGVHRTPAKSRLSSPLSGIPYQKEKPHLSVWFPFWWTITDSNR